MILDISAINRVAPYTVHHVPNKNFVSFRINYGVEYLAGFDKDDLSLLNTDVYQFSIINANNKKSPRDSKVRDTIIAIVENFFALNNEVMLYICETGDGKQPMRSRLFEHWFNQSKKDWNVLILSTSLYDEEGTQNYASIILRQDHPHLSEVVNEFTETVKLLNNKQP